MNEAHYAFAQRYQQPIESAPEAVREAFESAWVMSRAVAIADSAQVCKTWKEIMFIESWCGNCARDALCNGTKSDKDDFDEGELCPILAASFRGEAKEWIEHDDGRTECTAFVPMGDVVPQRCSATQDMFGESP